MRAYFRGMELSVEYAHVFLLGCRICACFFLSMGLDGEYTRDFSAWR